MGTAPTFLKGHRPPSWIKRGSPPPTRISGVQSSNLALPKDEGCEPKPGKHEAVCDHRPQISQTAEPETNAILTHLAVKEKVSAPTQNQPLSAMPFLLLLSLVFLAGVFDARSDEASGSFSGGREAALAKCSGTFKGKRISAQELKQVLEHHHQWLRDYSLQLMRSREAKQDPRRANLCGAILRSLNLSGVRLSGANLSAADLRDADLTGADLWGANLSYILATDAIFSKAYINTGSLEGASLRAAKFDNVILAYVNLRESVLLDTNLERANVGQADFARAIYEAELGALPHLSSLVTVKNLAHLKFDRSPHALVELRQAFRNAGLRSQERQVTYAIKHNERLKSGTIESAFSYLLFELTTK